MGILVAEGLIALGVLVGAGLGLAAVGKGAAGAVRRWSERKRLREEEDTPWKMHIHTDSDLVYVEVVRPGQVTEIATIDPGVDDFEYQLELAKSKARNVTLSLNSN